ncbi:MAG: HAD family hydrolase [Chloroflexota bacterium]|nr:HAD family hydrolase [Chloroflexota bacterium]
MPVRALLFDLDNTLVHEDASTQAAIRRTCECADLGPEAAGAAAAAAEELFRTASVFPYADEMGIWWGEALWGDFTGDAPGLRALRAFVPGFREAVWTTALQRVGMSDRPLARGLSATFARVRRSDWGLDPAAIPVLDAVARYRLALVTNGAPDVQRQKLEGTGIRSRFGAVIISAQLGIAKPDHRIFDAALDALGASAVDAVMIGDSIQHDIVGARRAGLRTIWIDRSQGGPAAHPADARITELGALPAALDEIRDRTAQPA